MSLFDFLRASPRRNSAQTAKERLQLVLAHERAGRDAPDFLPELQKELLAVIGKYIAVDDEKVEVKFERGGAVSMLEVNIELPERAVKRVAGGRG